MHTEYHLQLFSEKVNPSEVNHPANRKKLIYIELLILCMRERPFSCKNSISVLKNLGADEGGDHMNAWQKYNITNCIILVTIWISAKIYETT
jgi:hypothetical protein